MGHDNIPFRRSITLTNIDCACVIGICAREQTRAQPLFLDLVIELPPEAQHVSSLDHTIDYTVIVKAIQFFCQHGHWLLIEDLAAGLMRWLLTPPHPSEGRTSIERATLTIRKPWAVGDAALPSLSFHGQASGGDISEETLVLVDTGCVSARRIVLKEGENWTKYPRRCFFVLSGSLQRPSGEKFARDGIQGRTTGAEEYLASQVTVLLEIDR
jgi:dihydroneopterin aldolase